MPWRMRCTVIAVVARADVDAADRHISPGMVLVAAVALPLLPLLHVGNRLSTRRTLAVVHGLGRLPFPRIACRPRRVGQAVNGVAEADPSGEHDVLGTIAADLADPVAVRPPSDHPRWRRSRPRQRYEGSRLGGGRRHTGGGFE